eukprot:gene8761-8940_t
MADVIAAAVAGGSLQQLEFAVRKYTHDVNRSALHKALYQGSLAVAALLLAHDAALDLPDAKGRLPLDLISRELKQQISLAASSSLPLLAVGAGATRQCDARQQHQQQQHVGRRRGFPGAAAGFSCLYSWGNGANFTLGT